MGADDSGTSHAVGTPTAPHGWVATSFTRAGPPRIVQPVLSHDTSATRWSLALVDPARREYPTAIDGGGDGGGGREAGVEGAAAPRRGAGGDLRLLLLPLLVCAGVFLAEAGCLAAATSLAVTRRWST